jgi:alkylated DNA repair dioxygenase AlkB
LLTIKKKIESRTNEQFNSVLVNQYRNGSDGVAWHSDDENELGTDPIIASISLGEERQFQLKHKRNKQLKKSLILPHGSLLLMGKKTQLNWFHQVPKSKRNLTPRINLTYRLIT